MSEFMAQERDLGWFCLFGAARMPGLHCAAFSFGALLLGIGVVLFVLAGKDASAPLRFLFLWCDFVRDWGGFVCSGRQGCRGFVVVCFCLE